MLFKLNYSLLIITIISIILLTYIQSRLIENFSNYHNLPITFFSDDGRYHQVTKMESTDYSEDCSSKSKDDKKFRFECKEKHEKYVEKIKEDYNIRYNAKIIMDRAYQEMPETTANSLNEIFKTYNYTPPKGKEIKKDNRDSHRNLLDRHHEDRKEKIIKIRNDSKAERLNCFSQDKLNKWEAR